MPPWNAKQMSLYFYLVILFNRCRQGVRSSYFPLQRAGMLVPRGLPTSSLLPVQTFSSCSWLRQVFGN